MEAEETKLCQQPVSLGEDPGLRRPQMASILISALRPKAEAPAKALTG